MTKNWYESQIEKTKKCIKVLQERLLYYEAPQGEYLDKERKHQVKYNHTKKRKEREALKKKA